MRVSLSQLSKTYGASAAVDALTLSFEEKALTSVLGPSGCGKTTLLNMIAGIVPASSGSIHFDELDVTRLPPEKRGIGLVFQNYALYPHLSAAENIAFPLHTRRWSREAIRARVTELADLVQIADLLKRKPYELSGGQQQRVAIARALAKRPALLLMDEPLSNLDARLRTEMRAEIRRIQKETEVTMILVTHDQEDALSMSDSVLLLRGGNLEQYSSPTQIYGDPGSLFVLDFIGTPPASQLSGVVRGNAIELLGGLLLEVPGMPRLPDGDIVVLAIRAEATVLSKDGTGTEAVIIRREAVGRDNRYLLAIGGHEISSFVDADTDLAEGDSVSVSLRRAGVFLFDPATGRRLR